MPRKQVRVEDWSTSDKLLLIQSWAAHGNSQSEIAAQMQISRRTLQRWIKEYPSTIGTAMTNGGAVANAAVENKLFTKAMNGDTACIIFYLKNRAPQYWSEHPELRGFDGKVVFVDDIPKTAPRAESSAEAGTAEPADHT